ncbi:MAG: DUF1232 domain-containing protein, partial [Sediminibacterium sp.]|nr:DUF1232 domain-containing protein [Sediminibacterium sp.]
SGVILKNTIEMINPILYLLKNIKNASVQLVYSVLLMLYAYQSENTPPWAKRIILGAFAYLLAPIDSIPDLTPFLGLTDDLGVISFGLVTIACYINDEVRAKVRLKLSSIIKEPDPKLLDAVDSKL